MDRPGGRKDHVGEIPLVGGLGVLLAFAVIWVLAGAPQGWPMLAAMAGMVLLGSLDDFHVLSSGVRLLVQLVVAAFAVMVGGVVLPHIGGVTGAVALGLGWAAIPFTILCLVGLVNAINMSDGLDGLAGGMLVAMLGWLLVVGHLAGLEHALLAPAILLGAVVGFLIWNFPRLGGRQAYVFMGDGGSMALALVLGWFAVDLAFGHGEHVPPMVFAWILALPVIETATLMIRRLLRGRNPLESDREHLHHYLLWFGLSRRGATLFLFAFTLLLGGVGVAAWQLGVPDTVMFWSFVALGFAHLFIMESIFPRLGPR
ncbi:MraY family glycosyltransferase [Thioalkalivibrio sp. ALE11]|uniref:MraY family glycosyltransferase n=1 Tax=Thioalkalivibrio sp. ALE11 TaxID=1265494 RepID=UPI0003759118|nr:MraY family glycosyltransferase [Thioalkalivibrio sp. ALE11]